MKKVKEELSMMCNQAKEMLRLAYLGFKHHSLKRIEEAKEIGKGIHLQSEELTTLLVKEEVASLVGFPGHFERIGDAIESILTTTQTKIKEGLMLSDKALAEVDLIFTGIDELLSCLSDNIQIKNKVILEHMVERINGLNRLASESATKHEERLIAGICMPKVGPLYLNILDSLRQINWHIKEMILHQNMGEGPK